MIRAVVFDLDGVVRHFDPQFVADVEKRHGLDQGSLVAFAFSEPLLTEVVTGKISRATWIERIGRQFENSEVADGLAHQPSSVDKDILNLSDQLRELGIATAILTNGTDTIPTELAASGIDLHFDVIFNSAEIGYAKPDTRVFEHALNILNLAGAQVFFTDDSASKLTGADSLGIKTHLYTGLTQLRSALRDAGISLPDIKSNGRTNP